MPLLKSERQQDETVRTEQQHKRVLLGDDNPEILNIVREMLEPEFVVVAAVMDGTSVLREAAVLKPDIVVLDISMGEPDGMTVARQLRACPRRTVIVFLTVHEMAEMVRAGLIAGATAYVFKSRMNTDLIPALRAACSGRMFVSCSSCGASHKSSE